MLCSLQKALSYHNLCIWTIGCEIWSTGNPCEPTGKEALLQVTLTATGLLFVLDLLEGGQGGMGYTIYCEDLSLFLWEAVGTWVTRDRKWELVLPEQRIWPLSWGVGSIITA